MAGMQLEAPHPPAVTGSRSGGPMSRCMALHLSMDPTARPTALCASLALSASMQVCSHTTAKFLLDRQLWWDLMLRCFWDNCL